MNKANRVAVIIFTIFSNCSSVFSVPINPNLDSSRPEILCEKYIRQNNEEACLGLEQKRSALFLKAEQIQERFDHYVKLGQEDNQCFDSWQFAMITLTLAMIRSDLKEHVKLVDQNNNQTCNVCAKNEYIELEKKLYDSLQNPEAQKIVKRVKEALADL